MLYHLEVDGIEVATHENFTMLRNFAVSKNVDWAIFVYKQCKRSSPNIVRRRRSIDKPRRAEFEAYVSDLKKQQHEYHANS